MRVGCLLLIVNLDGTLICRQNEDTMQSTRTILSRASPFETGNETEPKPHAQLFYSARGVVRSRDSTMIASLKQGSFFLGSLSDQLCLLRIELRSNPPCAMTTLILASPLYIPHVLALMCISWNTTLIIFQTCMPYVMLFFSDVRET